jgi:hypothetical protein
MKMSKRKAMDARQATDHNGLQLGHLTSLELSARSDLYDRGEFFRLR